MVTRPKPAPFKEIGGSVALDFTNTVDGARGGEWTERLETYDDLCRFAHQTGVVGDREARALRKEARRRPAAAERMLARARALREAIYEVVTAGVAGERPDPDELALLNREHASAMKRARVRHAAGGFGWEWQEDEGALDRVLWPIARDATELLTSPSLSRVHECGGETCTWLFLDTSKNGRRRWCQMEVCGTLAKVRAHRARKKKGT